MFVRDGGWNPSGTDDIDGLRPFRELTDLADGGGELLFLEAAPMSIDCDRRFEVATSGRVGSAFDVEDAQCCESMDRLSSIGVNILLDLTDMRLTGSSSCCCCCGGSGSWIGSCLNVGCCGNGGEDSGRDGGLSC